MKLLFDTHLLICDPAAVDEWFRAQIEQALH